MRKDSLQNEEMLESDESFESAYESHAQPIYRFLLWRTHDIHLAEDLTSTTFTKAWSLRSSFHGGSTQAWLYRIARNTLIDHWRRQQPILLEETETLVDDASATLEESLDREYDIDKLQAALNRLPQQMQRVVSLRFIEGMSCKRVAKELKLTESNVRVIQYRALKKMKGYLQ